MYRNSFIIISVLVAMAFGMQAQQLAVKSFRSLPNDMDALQNYPLKDQNGEVCAIVKVQTLEKGFYFDNGSIGIVKTVQKPGEIWVYMPHGSKRLTITHEHFLPLRDYFFTEPIVEGACYELVLASGRSVTTIIPDEIETQWLIITSDPTGADVFIDDQPAGVTPYTNLLPIGKHSYRLQKPLYQNDAGMVELISGKQKKRIESKLKPNFGQVQLTTTPESGASVLLNGMETGLKTPCTLERVPAGQQTLSASLNMFATATQQFTMQAGETLPLTVNLKPSYGEVTVNTIPKADVFVNSQLKGNGLWQGRLNPGVYTFEARLEKHTTATEQRTVVIGEPLELTLQPAPRTGHLNVVSNPIDATIRINGKDYGTTPNTLKNFLIGDYTVELSLPGYATAYQKVTITEGETATVKTTLQNGRQVSINSTPTGASLFIDGKPAGTTPYNGSLTFGNHTLRIEQSGKQAEKQVTVSQTGGETAFSLAFDPQTFTETVNGVNFKMVAIKGGTFQMGSNDGSDDEKPVHSVTVRDFFMGETEVTVTQFEAFVKATGYQTDAEKSSESYVWIEETWQKKVGLSWRNNALGKIHERHNYNQPVIYVSWNDANAYCDWLRKITQRNYQLPTEAEWEYAAGGGDINTRTFWAGSNSNDQLQSFAWFNLNSKGQPHTVALTKPNGLGLYDMSGNVYEWCNDWKGGYQSLEQIDPIGVNTGTDRIIRGGSWANNISNLRTTFRYADFPISRTNIVGFRVVIRKPYNLGSAGDILSRTTDHNQMTEIIAFKNYQETINGMIINMVAIKGGTFQMGCNEGGVSDKPVHYVTVSDFFIGATEVTQELWKAIMGTSTSLNNPSIFNGDNLPVENVSWDDAQVFIGRLNYLTGKKYRLPTEAEWEYAAGGGSTNRTKWAGTNNENSLGSYAWYDANSSGQTHPVGSKSPNKLGVYDMSGNVWEWCEDDWHENYQGALAYGSAWIDRPRRSSNRVNRGGCWYFPPPYCRVVLRNGSTPVSRSNNLGFRLALSFSL